MENIIDWDLDPDWTAIAQNTAHSQHHIGIDRYGVYFCRECSIHGIYTLRDDEVSRLLLTTRFTAETRHCPKCGGEAWEIGDRNYDHYDTGSGRVDYCCHECEYVFNSEKENR